MSRKIFFSYSWKDNIAAMRIYDDLVRSHLNVWRDQVDGKPAVNFVEEFNAKIDECDDFLILDSPNYRHRSNWCIEEIKRFKDNRLNKEDRRTIVCLLEKEGDWRTQFSNKEQEQYFSEINNFKFYSFHHEGTYDNKDVYAKSMKEICELFSIVYTPWDEESELKDLEDEITAQGVEVSDESWNYILNEYKNIQHLIQKHHDVRERYLEWIQYCEDCGLSLFFPRYNYCLWLASDENLEKSALFNRECYDEFKKLAEEFPLDPRCQFGLGSMASILHLNNEAIKAYKTLLELLDMDINDWQSQHSKFYALVCMGVVLINDNQFGESIGYLSAAYDMMKKGNHFSSQLVNRLIECYDAVNNLKQCEELLLPLIEKYPLEDELHLELGRLYMKMHLYDKALQYFETSYVLSPHIKNAFYIIYCHSKNNHDICSKEMRGFAESLLVCQETALEDDFWKAAICHFLLHDDKKAQEYFPHLDYSTFPL